MDLAIQKFGVLELFSGIGGIHYAFHVAEIPHKIVAAVEINNVANEVYHHNFPECKVLQRNVQFLNAEIMDNFAVDFITMSPPCQPFTRQGLKNDCNDARTEPLLHIITLLKEMKRKPSYFFLENVKGFENSEACQRLLDVLKLCNYDVQQFLLSPKHLGIPNSRLRYYLLGKQKPLNYCFPTNDQILESIPECGTSATSCERLDSYLEELESVDPYLVPFHVLQKHGMILDIVSDSSVNSCCFTKGYVQYVEGTGSVIQTNTYAQLEEIYREVSALPKEDPKGVELLQVLGLRYFTPREVANIMCFPKEFSFPNTVSDRQKYRLLGNSVNVQVVASLLRVLLCRNKNHTSV